MATPPSPPVSGTFNLRSLCFALDVRPGQEVLIVGEHPSLARTVQTLGARSHNLATSTPSHLPVPDASFDHLIAVAPDTLSLRNDAGELFRVLVPGGSAFVTAHSRLRRPRVAQAVRAAQAARWVRDAGFTAVQTYGIWPTAGSPRHLVPLDDLEVLRWYVSSSYLPVSPRAAVVAKALMLAPSTKLFEPMFSTVAVLGHRPSGAAP